MIKAVIFDLDGTLLNTLEDLANASNFALRSCGYNEHPIKDYIRFVGSGRYILMKRILPEEDKNNEEAIEKVLKLFDEYYGEHMHDTTKPYDGIYELIKELKIKNIKLAVVSNKPDEFARTLQPTGFLIPDDTGGCGTETSRDHQQGRRKMSDGSLREYRDSLQYCEIVPDFI